METTISTICIYVINMYSSLLIYLEECQALDDPTNGEVIKGALTVGGKASYRCFTGYALVGDKMRVCQVDSTWNGTEPTCKRNGRFSLSGYKHFLHYLNLRIGFNGVRINMIQFARMVSIEIV